MANSTIDTSNEDLGVAENSGISFKSVRSHKIDFNKVNKLEDVISILKAMDLTVWDDGSEKFDPIRKFYKD